MTGHIIAIEEVYRNSFWVHGLVGQVIYPTFVK